MHWWANRGAVRQTTLVAACCLGALVGLAATQLGFMLTGFSWLLLGFLLLIVSYKRTRIALILILVAGFLFGTVRGSYVDFQSKPLQAFIGTTVSVQGVVAEDPGETARGSTELRLVELRLNDRNATGTIKVGLQKKIKVQRGDQVQVSGTLTPGFGNYQAKISFAKLESHTATENPALQLRDRFSSGVRASLSEPADSLGMGFLLGQRSELPKELDDEMRAVGLTHIVVASGYNLTVLVRASRRLFARFSKYLAFSSSMGLTIGFVIMTGFSPSMTRAAFVTGLSLLAWYYGRKIHPIVLLLLAAAVTALINPFFLWSDIGWYLSFLAFTGVLIVAPLLSARIFGNEQPSFMTQIAIETLVAQLLTLPLILWLFGDMSVFAVFANLLIVPFIPLAMLGIFLAGLIGMVLPSVAVLVGLPVQLLIEYMLFIIHNLASISWSVVELPISLPIMLSLYFIVIIVALVLWKKTRYNFLGSQITD